LPEWAKTAHFDLSAKVADDDVPAFRRLSQADRATMLRPILEERFRLQVHREAKEIPVYALVVGKTGPRMKPATPGDTYANGPKYPNGRLVGAGTLTPIPDGLLGQGVQMEQLVLLLSKLELGREVVGRTGLTGHYDFKLQFSPTEAMRPVINGQMQPLSADDAALPSVFTAVQEQLGLKLEPTKAPVQGLVIDHLERLMEN
jgi:uncharacterized protein (TIGR03435 family)